MAQVSSLEPNIARLLTTGMFDRQEAIRYSFPVWRLKILEMG